MVLTGPLVNTMINKNPGPGKYDVKGMKSNILYSLSGKIEY